MIHFNGNDKIIEIKCDGIINIEEIYSSWKKWALSDDNLKYLQAFYVINSNKQCYTLINDWIIVGVDKNNIKGRFL